MIIIGILFLLIMLCVVEQLSEIKSHLSCIRIALMAQAGRESGDKE